MSDIKTFSKRGSITIIDATDESTLTSGLIATPSKTQIVYLDNSKLQYKQDWSDDESILKISLNSTEFLFESGETIDILHEDNVINLKNIEWYLNSNRIIYDYHSDYREINSNNTLRKYFLFDDGKYKYKFNDSEHPTELYIKSNLITEMDPVEIRFTATYNSQDSGLTYVINEVVEIKLFTGDKNTVYIQLDGKSLIKPSISNSNLLLDDYAYIRASVFFNGLYLDDNVNIKYDWYTTNGSELINKNDLNQIDDNIKKNYLINDYKEVGSDDLLADYVKNIEFDENDINNFKNGNVLKIHKNAINNYETFKVVVTISDDIDESSAAGIYNTWFVITDNSDAITTQLITLNGDKFKNGSGVILIKPQLYMNGVVFNANGYGNIEALWNNYASDGTKTGFIINRGDKYFSYNISSIESSSNKCIITLRSDIIGNDFDGQYLSKFYDNDGYVYLIEGNFDRGDGINNIKSFTFNYTNNFTINNVDKIITSLTKVDFENRISSLIGNKFHLLEVDKITTTGISNTNDNLIIKVHHDDIDTKGSIECDIFLKK